MVSNQLQIALQYWFKYWDGIGFVVVLNVPLLTAAEAAWAEKNPINKY